MEWKEWIGKYVFVKLNSGGVYSGDIKEVDDSAKPLIFIRMIDKFGNNVMFASSEIIKIAEEGRR